MPGLAPSEIIANTPASMCWLCRREIEVSQPGKARGHRPSICRVITFYTPSQTSVISGIGYRLSTDAPGGIAFTVPRLSSASLTNPIPTPTKVDLVTSTGRSPKYPIWTFPVHADCWELLTARVSPSTCATMLSKALVTLNWNWAYPLPFRRSDIADCSLPRLFLSPSPAYSKSYHRRASLQRPSTFHGLAVELGLPPYDRSPVSQLPMKTPSPNLLSVTALKAKSEEAKSPWDIFSALPTHIIHNILCFVPTSNILNLRLASKTMVRAAQVDTLPQTFWESRFWPTFELGFAMPEDGYGNEGHGERDWNGLYFGVKEATRTWKRPLGADGAVNMLKKRKYWWERLDDAVRFCRRWEGVVLKGEQFSWVEQLDRDEEVHLVLREMGCVSAYLTHDDGSIREGETLCVPLDWCGDDMEALGVSVVDMVGQKYVCGIRMFLRTGETFELGYTLPETEVLVHFHPGEILFGFRVRVDDDAIRALKVITQTPLGRLHVSPWIGDLAGAVAKTSESTLQTTQSCEDVQELPLMGKFGKGSAVVACFDDFRMIAFGVAELIPSQG